MPVPLINEVLTAIVSAAILTLAGAIYYNRKKLNQLYQRLFGMEGDNTDPGFLGKMDSKMDTIQIEAEQTRSEVLTEFTDNTEDIARIESKLDELNHERIQDIEIRLEGLKKDIERIEDVQENLDKIQERLVDEREELEDDSSDEDG